MNTSKSNTDHGERHEEKEKDATVNSSSKEKRYLEKIYGMFEGYKVFWDVAGL